MREFKAGEIYTFGVVGIREEADQRKFIYLTDGVKETYRVQPYDYQIEWENGNLPSKMQCYVEDVNIWGLPTLKQVRWNVLNELYSEIRGEYAFTFTQQKVDNNTNTEYSVLRDAFGLYHRYYPQANEPKRTVGDVFSLVFTGIQERENNKDNLKLEPISENIPAVEIEVPKPENEICLNFGVESDVQEFKSTIVYPAGGITPDIDKQMMVIAKTIAGFQNRNGGKLYIGVNDAGNVVGINRDFEYLNSSNIDTHIYKANIDSYENKIRSTIKTLLGQISNSNIMFEFMKEGDKDFCVININKVLKPVFYNGTKLFERTGQQNQLLKDDAITWFIEDRYSARNNIKLSDDASLNNEIIDNDAQPEKESETLGNNKVEKKISELDIINHFKSKDTKPNIERLWYYFTFYKNGDWSYQKHEIATEDVQYQLPIEHALRKERLAICYKNGRVNVVNPWEITRNFRNEGRRYMNGWNTNSVITKMISLKSDDLLAFYSLKDNVEYVKIHNISAIATHGSIHLEGNVLINPNQNAELKDVYLIQNKYKELVSSLILRDNQRSTHLGISVQTQNYQNTFKTLRSIIE
jgi:hypothetical protein